MLQLCTDGCDGERTLSGRQAAHTADTRPRFTRRGERYLSWA